MVAGGIGTTSARIPPRRTGTVTATSCPVAIARAFHPSGATATYIRRSTMAYTTPLDRGSPAALTWLMTANDALPSARQTIALLTGASAVWASSDARLGAFAGRAVMPFECISDLSVWHSAGGDRGDAGRRQGW